eukprot:Hpha_TRINITY_DN16175_c2_g2::TRINITY_DN16175_c2_g2_i1::g.6800::m.6800
MASGKRKMADASSPRCCCPEGGWKRAIGKKCRCVRKWLCDGWLIILFMAVAVFVWGIVDLILNAKRQRGGRIILTCLGCAFSALVLLAGSTAARKSWQKQRRLRKIRKEKERRMHREEEERLFEQEEARLDRVKKQVWTHYDDSSESGDEVIKVD